MSLITACPACETTFHVQPEQLAMHHGDVRCGNCSQLFNALARLAVDTDHPVPSIAETPAEPSGVFAYTVIDRDRIHSPATVADAASKDKLSQPAPSASHHKLAMVLSLSLVVLALLQISYYQRTQIAAHWPLTKPYLIQACNLLDCEVGLPRQAELLAIDDSDLQEDAEYQGLMHFSGTIINNAAYAQAYPLLELTLTDVADQALLRRIFSANEYLPADADLSAGIAAQAELRVQLNLAISEAPVVGYRVFIAYADLQ